MLLACATTQGLPWDSRPQALSPLGLQSCRPGPRPGGSDGHLTWGSSLSWLQRLLLGWVITGSAKLRAPESSSLPTSGGSPSLAAGSAGRLSPLLCENQVKRGPAGLWIGGLDLPQSAGCSFAQITWVKKTTQKNKDAVTSCFFFVVGALNHWSCGGQGRS